MTDKELGTAAGEIFAKAFTLGYETGREYAPVGGMALTAEQVEDVRTAREGLRGYRNFDGNARGRVNRLIAAVDALFPATEPAEDGWGDVNPNDPLGRTYREKYPHLASSPVVPVSTETGPCQFCDMKLGPHEGHAHWTPLVAPALVETEWHAVAEIPKAVACIKDREGDVWRRCGSGWEHGALHDPVDYSPFVAVKEEEA